MSSEKHLKKSFRIVGNNQDNEQVDIPDDIHIEW